MADEELMDLDEVIEEEAPAEDVLATSLVVITAAFLLISIIVALVKLGNDYQAGLLG
jgi:hypothetical protein